jgi:hypothetical protein
MRDPLPGKKSWSKRDRQLGRGGRLGSRLQLVLSCFEAAQRDSDLIGVDHDPFDMLADEFQVGDVIVGLENGEQRPAPDTYPARAEIPKIPTRDPPAYPAEIRGFSHTGK